MDDAVPDPQNSPREASVEVPAGAPVSAPPAAEIPAAPAETIAATLPEPPSAIIDPAPEVDIPALEPVPQASQVVSGTSPAPPSNWKTDYQPKGLTAIRQKIERRLEKILTAERRRGHLPKQGSQSGITNRDIIKLVRISDATATRYLKILTERGQLQKVGRGRSVAYTM